MPDGLAFNGPDSIGAAEAATKEMVRGDKLAQSPDEIYAVLRERFDRSQQQKYWFERQWIINTAHYCGQPNIGFNKRTGAIAYVPKDHPQRVRISDPIIPYLLDTRKARILRAVPEPVVLPCSSADEDRYKAKLASKIVKYLLEKYRFGTFISESLILSADIYGAGFLKTSFDPLAGDHYFEAPAVDDATGQPKTDEQGNPMVEYIPEGEICLEAVSPFEIFPDPAATGLHDCKWLIQCKEISVKDAIRLFPAFEEDIIRGSEGQDPRRLAMGVGLNVLYDFPNFSQGGAQGQVDRVVIYEMYERASAEYPSGRHIIAVNRTVVLDEPTPEEYDELPYEMVSSFPVPGRFWPEALTTYLVQPQLEYNRRRSQIMENLNAHAWLRLLTPRGALLNTFTKDAHHVWEFDVGMAKGFKPEIMQIPSMPPEAFKQLQDIKSDMEEMSGVHDVSRGENPSSARTGRAMWFLQEADDTRLERVVQRYHSAIEGVCTRMLKLARTHYTRQRLAYQFVPHDIEVMEFTGSELGENVRVIIDPRAKAPLSMTQRIDLFMNMYEADALVNDMGMKDPKKLMELLNLQNTDTLFEDESLHRMRARKENMQMRQGQPAQEPGPYEDHDIHLEEHRKETLQDRWYTYPPQMQQLVMQHIFVHEVGQIRQAEMAGRVPPGTADAMMSGDFSQMQAPMDTEVTIQNEAAQDVAKKQGENAAQGGGPPGAGGGGAGGRAPIGDEKKGMKPDVGDRGMDQNRDGVPGAPGAPKTPTGTGKTARNY